MTIERDPTDLGLIHPPEDPPPHRCDNGWIINTTDDGVRPCPTCKPHLVRNQDRNGIVAWRTRPRTGAAR